MESWGAGLLDDLGSLQVDSIVKRDERLADAQKTVDTLRKSVTCTRYGISGISVAGGVLRWSTGSITAEESSTFRRMRLACLFVALTLVGCSFYDRGAPPAGAELSLAFPEGTSAAEVAGTVDVLKARIEPAGWRWSEFTVEGTRATVRVGPLDDFTRTVLTRLLTKPYALSLHIAPTGADPATWTPKGDAVFTNGDVENSYLEAMRKGTRVSLALDAEAGRRLLAATSPDGGGLVVFVDENREMATHLNGPLRGRIVKLTPAGASKDDIHLRAVELISAWKAGPMPAVPTLDSETTWGGR